MNTRLFKLALAISLMSLGIAVNALAAHGGGGFAGGMSPGHLSAQGIKNTNGPASLDRDKGLARAEDRRSLQGTTHEKAAGKHSHSTHH